MFTAGHFVEKTKFMAKQMHFAFPHCYFGKAVSGQNQVLVYTVLLAQCLGLYKPYFMFYCLAACRFPCTSIETNNEVFVSRIRLTRSLSSEDNTEKIRQAFIPSVGFESASVILN